jgi:Na+/H+ antiporter NhaD/arsenite permease-like protein
MDWSVRVLMPESFISSIGLLAAGPDHLDLPVWTVTPFALLLLAIALLPLLAEHFWHDDRNKAIVVALLSVPVVAYLAYLRLTTGQHTLYPLVHELGKYASFIILIGSLYVVAGGVVIRGGIRATARNNTLLLAIGALLANFIGTTGSSVLLIRPFLRINSERKSAAHLPVFFIFLVSNMGGCLTPMGDPPLFMGYLNDVPFFWTLHLWPEYLVAIGLVLMVFFVWESLALRGTKPSAVKEEPIRLDGNINLLFLGGILAAVVVECDWLPMWDLFGGELTMLVLAVLSLWLTPKKLRQDNNFNWRPVVEVAIVFAGVFVTMVPALQLLEARGQDFGLRQPWQFFWTTGLLSSALDNAPTYLAFGTVASGSNDFGLLVADRVPGLDGPAVLRAISCGAVFFGALTYIGNGPNFMIKAICEQAGFRPPSFFTYLLYSGAVLLPIFLLLTVLFYRTA